MSGSQKSPFKPLAACSSRREFMQRALAAGMTVPAAQLLLAQAALAAPSRGGTFKFGTGQGSSTDSLDPTTWASGFMHGIGKGVIGAHLTEIDAEARVQPHLAQSFEPSDGAKTWVFDLRPGVTFHNGKTVTADDVVATFNTHRSDSSKSGAKSLLRQITEITTDGPNRVIFKLSGANADFPYIATDYHLPIFPANADGSIDWQGGIGAGAYIIDVFEPGVRCLARRNPDYFIEDSAWFDSIEMLYIPDVTARTSALLGGVIHYMDRCDLKTLNRLKANPNVEITDVISYSQYVAPMNTTVAPFNDRNVRLAIKHAIDRQDLVNKILSGHGAAGNDTPVSPTMKFHHDPQPRHVYDPDKVKFYLGQAGLTSLDVDLHTSNNAFVNAVDTALLMQAHAKAAGININVIRQPDDGYWDNVWMKQPWCMSNWSGRPVADMILTAAYSAESAWNDTFWQHERFNELLVAARAETDESTRASMYKEMQEILHEDGGGIVLMFNNYVSAHAKSLQHGPLNADADHDGGHIFERWWFA